MAYENFRTKEHAFKTIQGDVKQGKVNSLILLCGEEQYLVHWAVDVLVNKYINKDSLSMDYNKTEPENTTVQSIIESCETLSMFSERRIVVAEDFPLLWSNEVKGFPESDMQQLLEYLEDVPESSILIFTGRDPDKRSKRKSKLYKAIEKYGTVYDFGPLDMRLLRGFIGKRFKAAAKSIKPAVTDMIIKESGYMNPDIEYNLYNLENDIKKIIAHCRDEEIIPSDVALTMSDSLETNVFAMIDAVSRNRKDEAYRLLNDLLVSGENVYKLLALITSQLELILEVKELKDGGCVLKDMQGILKVHQFRVKKAMSFTERFSSESIRNVLIKAYEVDRNIKTGLMDQNLALEFFIAEI